MEEFTKVEKQFCLEITQKIIKHPLSYIFREPVDPERDGLEGYREIVKKPMDLTTLLSNLKNGEYSTSKDWAEDLYLIWSNAKDFNYKDSLAYLTADYFNRKSRKMLKLVPKSKSDEWLLKINKIQNKIELYSSLPKSDLLIPIIGKL